MATFAGHQADEDKGQTDLFFDTAPTKEEIRAACTSINLDWDGYGMDMDAGVVVFPSKVAGTGPLIQQARHARVRLKGIPKPIA